MSEKNLGTKKKDEKKSKHRRGFEPGLPGREAGALPRSYRCFDVKMLKINEFIITKSN